MLLRILDNLYIVKRILSWLFHTVGLYLLVKRERTWGRYSASWRYVAEPTYTYTFIS